ncbi:S8 family peptidase [Melghirimyces algeriensis]|uniref:Subtilisin n=1 Tax=Melghirimyces algeriensis TaxID=910412 RepID=A0A521CSS1_9BACL|nr:S8 family peptidase [Melghirimyces algeriensis]SMO61771.1 subtilisin [Melghirimyces algeriensis]
MNTKNHASYTLLLKSPSAVNSIRRLGGFVDYVSGHTGLISMRIPRQEISKFQNHPDIMLSEKDNFTMIPHPKVSHILTREEYQKVTQSARQVYTWNVGRVWRGKPEPKAGKGIRVGVIDTGIDLNHPDLVRNIRGGVNLVHSGRSPQDDNGHGTHVAGIIAAQNNRLGVVGVAPSVNLYAIKVLNSQGSGTVQGLIRGIDWGIDHGMHILNISLSTNATASKALIHAINAAVRKGILVVAAAGNSGNRQGTGDSVESPARIPSAVAVASINRNNRRASFSSVGSALDLSAPGVKILSTYKDDKYAVLSGTSMAAPHVSGAAAVLWRWGKTAPSVRNLLYQRAMPIGSRRLYGRGLVQVKGR